MKTDVTPTQLPESDIILLYKKGIQKTGSYRPIVMLSSISKLFFSLINQIISKTLDASQSVEQAGFRKSYATIDYFHTLELLIQKYQEERKPLFITYTDYQKAFLTVSHDIWYMADNTDGGR